MFDIEKQKKVNATQNNMAHTYRVLQLVLEWTLINSYIKKYLISTQILKLFLSDVNEI